MTKLALLSAGLIAATTLVAPAMARESHTTSRYLLIDPLFHRSGRPHPRNTLLHLLLSFLSGEPQQAQVVLG